MGLSHLTFASATVSTPGGDFAVRGLNLEDIIHIVRLHADSATALFQRVKAEGMSFTDNVGFLASLAQQAPETMITVICVGADEDNPALVRKLTFPQQLDALEKIVLLTFESEGGAKKVMETIIRVTRATAAAIKGLQA